MLRNPWIYITEACNLSCAYCFNPEKAFNRADTIALNNFARILENILLYSDLSENAPLRIVLFGGEPTLHPRLLKELMDYSYERLEGNVHFHLITNGTNIAAVEDYILEYRKKSALSVQLSIDAAPGKPTLRVKGDQRRSYENSLRKTFDFLIANSIGFTIRATLSPNQVKDLWDNFRYFLSVYDESDGLIPNITFSPDFLSAEWTEADFSEMDKQVEKIIEHIKDDYVERKKIIYDTFAKKAFLNMYRKNRGITQPRRTFCGFSNNLFSIAPNGDGYACHRVYENSRLKFGNFVDGSVDIARLNGMYSVYNNPQFIRPNRRIGIEKCDECEIRWICGAVCPAKNANMDGLKDQYECDYVMYRMQKSYVMSAAQHMAVLLEDENYVKRMVN